MLAARLGDGIGALHGAVRVLRGWGDCYGHCLVASGRLDAMLDPAMNPWDCCALVPILQEAGGRVHGLDRRGPHRRRRRVQHEREAARGAASAAQRSHGRRTGGLAARAKAQG